MAGADKKNKRARSRVQADMLGLDFTTQGTKGVRIKRTNSGLAVTAAGAVEEKDDSLDLPRTMNSHHVAFCASSPEAVIRLITLPGNVGAKINESQLREQIGIKDTFRLTYTVVPTENKGERRILAVGIPLKTVQDLLGYFDQPQPAPISMEVSSLSALTAFMKAEKPLKNDEAYGFIESGSHVNLVSFFSRGQLVLLRKFDFGGSALIDKVQRHLGLERDVAAGLVTEGSFDLSEPVRDVVGPFFRQLSISKDFVERHQRTRLGRVYISGGMSISRYWLRELSSELGMDVVPWNPFTELELDLKTKQNELLEKEGARYTAALGAALGAMEDE